MTNDNFNQLHEEKQLNVVKSVRKLILAFFPHIVPKIGIVEKLVLPNDIPDMSEFNKIADDIFNICKQLDPTFPELRKFEIMKDIIEKLKENCDNALALLLKEKELGNIPTYVNVVKTEIIIEEEKSLSLNCATKQSAKICRKSTGALFSGKKDKLKNEIKDDTQKDSFGKTKNDYLIEAFQRYGNLDFDETKYLHGTINLIAEIYNKHLQPNNIKENPYNIIRLSRYELDVLLQTNKELFSFFDIPDKKDKFGNYTQFQEATKHKILKKILNEIVPMKFPVFGENQIIFIQPIGKLEPYNFGKNPAVVMRIDTRILLPDFAMGNNKAFLYTLSMEEISAIEKEWENVTKSLDTSKSKVYKNFRLFRFKDIPLKAISCIPSLFYGTSQTEKGFTYVNQIQIRQSEWQNKIMPEERIDKHLKSIGYKINMRTKEEIRLVLDYITFTILTNCGYMKNTPKLKNDIYHFNSLNSYKFSKSRKLPKNVLNKT